MVSKNIKEIKNRIISSIERVVSGLMNSGVVTSFDKDEINELKDVLNIVHTESKKKLKIVITQTDGL